MNLLQLLLFLIQDKFFFWFLQFILLGLLLFAFTRDYLRKGSGIAVKRGNESKDRFRKVVSGFTSIIISLIVNVSSEGEGYKVFITTVDLICIIYLGLFSSWGRNKIIGIYEKFENKVEEL